MTSQNAIRTRSGLEIQRSNPTLKPMPGPQSNVEKSSKMKKERKDKVKAERKVAKLDKPLSELTAGWTHIPVVDIEAYVNRSTEVRRREVEESKTPGRVKRPMNSFMLYRKAYQNRTKDWCLHNNHQVVSQVCGNSWPLEPDHIKNQFNEWARIERMNHQVAHPDYKFSPCKPGISKATKRKASEEPDSEESELEDFEWQTGRTRHVRKQRLTPRPETVAYPTSQSAYSYSRDNSLEVNQGGYNRSSYHANNPGKPHPAQYNQVALADGQYYQQTIQAHPTVAGIEDVIIRKTTAPGMHYVGLPGGQEHDLMYQHQFQYAQYEPPPPPEHKIDPALMAQDQVLYDGNFIRPENVYFGGSHDIDQHWQAQYGLIGPGMNHGPQHCGDGGLHGDSLQIHEQHMHILRGQQEGWQVDPLDPGQEFDNWMGEE